jgi:hypothetical protein
MPRIKLSYIRLECKHRIPMSLLYRILLQKLITSPECWGLSPLKFPKLVTLLRLWCWLVSLGLLLVGHSLLHGLQHLSLHYQHLLKCWWWRRVVGIVVVVVVLVGTTVVSVGHLMIAKRFEIELKIEIQDSQLYASRYTDD